MSKQAFDKKLEELEALRSASHVAAARVQLGKALKDRNNYLVSRAAAIAGDLKCEQLIPDLLAAFDRFFVDPVKTDPQCLAKNAIANALQALEHRDAQPYVRGIVHFQFEPASGGPADTAATLRGTCAVALSDCYLDPIEILTYLGDGLADPDKSVRINCVIAIDRLGQPAGALLLRLKVMTGDPEPDVLGQCFTSLLSLAPSGAVSFISRFLQSSDADIQLEAASALAQSRDPEAIEVIKEFWAEPHLSLDLRRVLLINLGASPVPAAAGFLLSVIRHESAELAGTALTALATSRFQAELRTQIAAAVEEKRNPDLRRIFEQKFAQHERD